MSVLVEIERILRSAQRRIRALGDGDVFDASDAPDLVLIEVVAMNLDMNIQNLRAAASPEGANIDAPEEPSAPRH